VCFRVQISSNGLGLSSAGRDGARREAIRRDPSVRCSAPWLESMRARRHSYSRYSGTFPWPRIGPTHHQKPLPSGLGYLFAAPAAGFYKSDFPFLRFFSPLSGFPPHSHPSDRFLGLLWRSTRPGAEWSLLPVRSVAVASEYGKTLKPVVSRPNRLVFDACSRSGFCRLSHPARLP